MRITVASTLWCIFVAHFCFHRLFLDALSGIGHFLCIFIGKGLNVVYLCRIDISAQTVVGRSDISCSLLPTTVWALFAFAVHIKCSCAKNVCAVSLMLSAVLFAAALRRDPDVLRLNVHCVFGNTEQHFMQVYFDHSSACQQILCLCIFIVYSVLYS